MRRYRELWLGLLLLALVGGCASQQGEWHGPETAARVQSSPWSYQGRSGHVLRTKHYLIHTTVTEKDVLAELPQVMEGAYGQYRVFAGGAAGEAAGGGAGGALDCYVFATRREWADFTRRHTGRDAAVYLQITRGGYTLHDWFVSYDVGSNATYSVAAHEGWHQFVARNFAARLPPFLEEGTACMFESVRFVDGLPRWDVTINPARALSLRNAIDGGKLWPLEKLITMHAGDVVRLPGDRVEAFYAESWAFALFLNEYNHGEYQAAFRRLMADTAAGNPNDRGQAIRKALNLWSPTSVKPMLERYLGKDLPAIAKEYDRFIHHVAYDQITRQWSAKPG